MRCDVCLILEGTYPYVSGGVSTWVAQLLESMPDINFGIIYLGANRNEPRRLRYEIPPNVTAIREIFIHDAPDFRPQLHQPGRIPAAAWDTLRTAQHAILEGQPLDLPGLREVVTTPQTLADFYQEFAASRDAWSNALDLYHHKMPRNASFIDFYWSSRFILLPLLQLLRAPLVRARVFHCACTGYAGILGALLSRLSGAPLLISEHGIYTRERRIEIFDADWISGSADTPLSLDLARESNFYKEWWVNLFLSLSRTAYAQAARIFSLFGANRRDQIADGARPERVHIIPNGININAYRNISPPPRAADDTFCIGYIGRIAPIKDVKTLIRALDQTRAAGVKIKAYLMGPEDEDEAYAAECHELVRTLALNEEVVFTGKINVADWLPKLHAVVISSISEGLPFAILEAGSAGIPVVSTDVGACRELLEGPAPNGDGIGPGGITVPIASALEMAVALTELARNPQTATAMGADSRRRMQRFYDLQSVTRQYRQEYEYWMEVGYDASYRLDEAQFARNQTEDAIWQA